MSPSALDPCIGMCHPMIMVILLQYSFSTVHKDTSGLQAMSPSPFAIGPYFVST